MEVFSKVYYDRVYFLRAERFMTGSSFQPPAAHPDHLKVQCPPPPPGTISGNGAGTASTYQVKVSILIVLWH